jgi:GTPase SAR1 family protein
MKLFDILNSNVLTILIGILSGMIATLTLNRIIKSNKVSIAYQVAIIGFPQSGKTTLITSIFSEIFKMQYSGFSFIARGKQTIEKINDDIARLEMGQKLGPTRDQDLFAYRVDVINKSMIFQRRYKMEIGDYPGEDSESFSKEFGNWFHNTSFFKWVMEADTFVFIIDLAKDFIDDEYQSIISSAIRAAWQNITEYHIEGKRNILNKKILIVFTKADVLFMRVKYSNEFENESKKTVSDYGFGNVSPKKVLYIDEDFKNIESTVLKKYSNIVMYLQKQVKNFDCILTSYFAIDEQNERMGIKKIITRLLPL